MKKLLLALFLAFAPTVSAFAAGDLIVSPQAVTIASGQSLSGAIDLGPYRAFAIIMPASWTTANLTFQVSADGVNYANLYDDSGNEVTVTAAASRYIIIASPAKMLGVRWAKVRSGTSGSPVTQGADRAISLVGVP